MSRKTTGPLTPLVEGYLSYAEDVKRLTARTIVDIRCTLNKVCQYIEEHHPGKELWQLNYEEYLRWVGAQRNAGKSATSLNKQISHIRGMLEYAWRNGRVDRNVLDGFTLKDAYRKNPPRALTLEEITRLVESMGRKNKLQRKKRMMILYFSI